MTTTSEGKPSIFCSAAVDRSNDLLPNSESHPTPLRTWRNKALGQGRAAEAASAQPKGRSGAPLADPAAEIRRLQRENEYLRRQREILKKAVSILSED